VNSQGCRLITVVIPSDLRISTSYYYCIYRYACSRIKHERDYESQGQVGVRILNEGLGPAKKFLEMRISRERKEAVENITS